MTSDVSDTTPIVIAVVVTNRVAEFGRLMASLDPVAPDPNVHVVALDNGARDDVGVFEQASQAAGRSAGTRAVVRASRPDLPLHAARREVSAAVTLASAAFARTPIVWMIDDDLTFEEVRIDDGVIVVRNVAAARIASARALCRTDIDILVSGFTGDPPVRPEAVLASQLIDLRAALRFAAGQDPSAAWIPTSPYVRLRDDYYDHAESADWHRPVAPVPWLPRHGPGRTVGDQTRAFLDEARFVPRGCTPFRPLLACDESEPVRVRRADRGGNTIFRGLGPMLAHPYPAFPVGDRFSRRSDMVGLNVLIRRGGPITATGNLTLRHDRTLQPPFTDDIEPWLAEFAGVLLSRATAPDSTDALTPESLAAMAHCRADRIARALHNAERACEACLEEFQDPVAWWQHSPTHRVLCKALTGELRRVSGVLVNLRRSGLNEALRSADLRQRVWGAFTELRGAWT